MSDTPQPASWFCRPVHQPAPEHIEPDSPEAIYRHADAPREQTEKAAFDDAWERICASPRVKADMAAIMQKYHPTK